MVQPLQQLLHFGALAQIATRNVVAQNLLPEFLQTLLVGRLVYAIDSRAMQRHEARGHGLVRQEHEFFDQLV